MLTLKSTPPANVGTWHPIDLGPAGSLEVLLKRPMWGDLMADAEMGAGFMERRLRACVLDWRGVESEDGRPLTFSLDGFKALCVAHPQVAHRASIMVSALYLGLEDAVQKKLDEPSVLPSTGNQAQAETETKEPTSSD